MRLDSFKLPAYIPLVFDLEGETSEPTGMYELLHFDFTVFPSCNLEQPFEFPAVISFPRFNLIMRAKKFPNKQGKQKRKSE